ncbi:MAG TPA: DUF3754 domain-containing protein [Gemmataceae bacterium]|nr:DUF3754 domain-containing protein [Gemmataceae bacterium]
MAEYTDREHYIPLRVSDLVDLLCGDKGLSRQDAAMFRQFCTLVTATYHFEYHQKLAQLKDEYAPFDPDSVTTVVKPLLPEEKQQRLEGLFERFTWLMERANYKRLDRAALEAAMQEVSLWGINMDVAFDAFERMELFVRGDHVGRRYFKRWWQFWKQPEEVRVPTYQRLALILKLRPHKRLPRDIDTQDVYLKLFKDIPKADIEMLLPGGRLQMPGLVKLKMSGSFLSGLGYVLFKFFDDILRLITQGLHAVTTGVGLMWAPVAALLGYGYKQWYGYQFAKKSYTLQLTQSLYYQTLDSNAGVLNHLLDEAEEQECREAILAYYYLLFKAPPNGWRASELDDYVEMDLERLAKLKVDFEIEDAIAKLEKLRIVEKVGDHYRAQPLAKALEQLDWTWDNYFKYNNPEPEASPL